MKRKNYSIYLLSGFLITPLIIGGYLLLSTKIFQKNQIITNIDYGDLPPLGNHDAPVKILEFGDYLCPYCAKTANEFIPQIKDLINQGKVAFYWRDFVVHPNALIIHNAARCANDENKYWQFHEKVFQYYFKGLNTKQKDDLMKIAKELNLDSQLFEKCLDEEKYNQEVLKSTSYGFQIGVRGTPTFFVNGEKVVGANFSLLMSTINKYLKKQQ